jgi:hypothetical protein
LDLQLLVQSVPITTEVLSSNTTHGEVYSIQLYVSKTKQKISKEIELNDLDENESY